MMAAVSEVTGGSLLQITKNIQSIAARTILQERDPIENQRHKKVSAEPRSKIRLATDHDVMVARLGYSMVPRHDERTIIILQTKQQSSNDEQTIHCFHVPSDGAIERNDRRESL
eukprot:scaffold123407_cov37-Attheya_sp.AAC.1